MFPESRAIVIRGPQSSNAQIGDTVAADQIVHGREAGDAAASQRQIESVLRIRAALRAAHQDAVEAQLADYQWHEWTWTVKALPKPPLVMDSMEELDSEELLANDSLGG